MKLSVRMPQFGESAAEATVVAWLVTPGSQVAAEQELVEVQTEKSLLTVAAPAAGILAEQCAEPGHKLAVGDVLAYLEVAGGDSPVPSDVHDIGTAPKAKPLARPHRPHGATDLSSRDSGRAAVRAASGESAFISPRVRAKLLESGLKVSDLATIPGSGADGRITAEDIDHYLSQGEAMSPVRQAVANAMTRSWTRPLATIARPVRMDALLAHRRTVEGRPSATIYCMRALALALKAGNPLACRLFGNRLLTPSTIDLAVAVEITDGVLTPVVRKVESIDLAKLTTMVEDVIAKGRDGRVSDAGDAVATVSNYGTFGLTWATPIPLPGQGLILGIGAVKNVPDWNPATKSWDRARESELTLTFDHRIADGGVAARLLHHVAELLEHPEKL
ncbi:MAG: 2-oxo acid dehydrogenase subunit E2 [Planctomycetes bacterium]|nr:2-oxo acid dehydrogenase subunit E2 [Planctomycetota bacterium]